jgi:histidine triad (HIT) family protein
MEPTLFERIVRGDIPSHPVARGDGWYAFLDVFPRRSGHTLVVPVRGVPRLSDLNQTERHALMDGVCEARRRLSAVFETDDFLVLVHDGAGAGQEIPHVHVHLLPRTPGDGGRALPALWPAEAGARADDETLAALSMTVSQA